MMVMFFSSVRDKQRIQDFHLPVSDSQAPKQPFRDAEQVVEGARFYVNREEDASLVCGLVLVFPVKGRPAWRIRLGSQRLTSAKSQCPVLECQPSSRHVLVLDEAGEGSEPGEGLVQRR